MKDHQYFVYITTNPNKTVLYTGVTNDVGQRIIEHYLERGKPRTFAGRYFCYFLLYYEHHKYIEEAIAREKQIKGWTRKKKEELIKTQNQTMKLLNFELYDKWPPDNTFHRKEFSD